MVRVIEAGQWDPYCFVAPSPMVLSRTPYHRFNLHFYPSQPPHPDAQSNPALE